ncbi:MAG: NifB/NifX family molybdenum-iron cluster-binding protein [Bacteroidota bacterium]
MKEEFTIAIALTKNLQLPENHFGESEKFLIYSFDRDKLHFKKSIPNQHRNDDEQEHGNPQKGQNIARLLQNERVDCVVSRFFGKNIHIISEHFLPVISPVNDIKQLVSLLEINAEKIILSTRTHKLHPSGKALKL